MLVRLPPLFTRQHNDWRKPTPEKWQGITINTSGQAAILDLGEMPLAAPLRVSELAALWTPALCVLSLSGPMIRGRLEHICKASNLRTLALGRTGLKGDLRALGDLKGLKRLNLEGSSKLAGSVNVLKTCILLENVILNNNRNISGNIEAFSNMPELQVLSVEMTAVLGHIECLRACRKLHTLKCKHTRVVGDTHTLLRAVPLCDAREILALNQRLDVE